ncbi:MAG: hypothetical protein AAGF67_10305 [Verrucomicrobiota bacterium]
MKVVISAFLGAVCILTPAVGNEDLNKLTTQRDAALKRAVEPINSQYVEKLEKLTELLTKNGDLDGAVQVKAETVRVEKEPTRIIESIEGPDRLELLFGQRKVAISRAIEPIERVYIQQLESLLESATRGGDLESALTFREELENVGALPTRVPDVPEQFGEKDLLGTIWGFRDSGNPDRFRFEESGLFRVLKPQTDGSYKAGNSHTWKVHNAKRREISITFHNGVEEVMKMNSKTTEFDNESRAFERIPDGKTLLKN